MMRWLALVVLMLAEACASTDADRKIARDHTRVCVAEQRHVVATLIDLVVDPERYSGCIVQVAGLAGNETASTFDLFATREDRWSNGAIFGPIRVHAAPGNKDIGRVNHQLIEVRGVFHDATTSIEAEWINVDVASNLGPLP